MPALPSAVEQEKALLSCCLQAPEHAIPAARPLLTERSFHFPAHALLWEIMLFLMDAGRPVEVLSVQQVLADRRLSEETGGQAYLLEVFMAAPTPAHARFYAEQVAEKAGQRAIVQACWRTAEAIMEEPEDWRDHATALVDAAVTASLCAAERATIVPIKDAIFQALDEVEEAMRNRGHVTQGTATGFTDLDRSLMGLRAGDNCFIAARPSMGKTALAVNILENLCLGRGHYREYYNDPREWPDCREPRQQPMNVVLVCLESSQVKMAKRMLMGNAGVSMQRIRDGMMGKNDMKSISDSAVRLGQSQFHIWDAAGISVEELELELKAFKQRRPDLGAVCVDHCGLLSATAVKDKGDDYARVGYISSRLRNLWKKLDVVGLPVWQLGRGVEKRPDKRPLMADLRDSGKLEEDATHVIMPFRPSYYDEKQPADEAYLIIGKNRDGPTNKEGLPVSWDGELTRFSSLHDRLFSNDEDKRQQH